MRKYVYILKGLDCAGCAATIEQELRSVNGLTGVTIDFIDKELTFYVKEWDSRVDIKEHIAKIIKRIDPDIELVLSDEKNKNVRFRDSLTASLMTVESITTILGLLVVVVGLLSGNPLIKTTSFIVAYLLIGWQIIIAAARRVFSRYIFNEQFLMTVATIGAILIGEYLEAIAVMLFYQIGSFLENKMVDYSQKSISQLLAISPEYANQFVDGQTIKTDPNKIKMNDLIIIKPGERVPLDCTVVDGISEIDNSFITGESLPVSISPGTQLLSGAINLSSVIKARVDKEFSDSTISRIADIIKSAKSKKTQTERFISRFANIYTPVVMGLALMIALLPPLLFTGSQFRDWFYRSLIFLVISCPCALVISVPLSFFSGLAVLIKKGVLIKGAVYIEDLAKVDKVFLDKTGTLTIGKMNVINTILGEGVDEETLLRYAYYAESHSNHPLAIAVNMKYHQIQHENSNTHETLPPIESVTEYAGKGLIVETAQGTITVGSISFLEEKGINVTFENNDNYPLIAVAVEDKFMGIIQFSDTMRDSIPPMISRLKKKAILTIMLTGDKKEVAETIAKETGIDKYFAGLTPEDKMSIVKNYAAKKDKIDKKGRNKGKTIFIGDGINDAPAMSVADVGIAMGGIGAAVSLEAADVILQTDEIDKLADIITIARKTVNKAKENIAFAIGIKSLFLLLGAMGIITIWGAVFADVGVTLLAVLNSLRLLKHREGNHFKK